MNVLTRIERKYRPACLAAFVLASCAAGARSGENPLDADRAYGYLKQICDLGPRPSGSQAMNQQRELLTKHFRDLGGQVSEQKFVLTRHPLTGAPVPMANLIVSWHPQKTERILLCAHYDTRPKPDNDPIPRLRQTGDFIGANDGASGVAVLMELAHLMPQTDAKYGVDFVLFDGEELVFGGPTERQIGEYFIGSTYFAQHYVENRPPHRYRWGVLLDMVGDADLRIYQEDQSATWRDTQPLVEAIWSTAQRLDVREFIPRRGFEVRDDHVPLRNIGRIPTCDIIDFEYPAYPANIYWHSVEDKPDKCSGESLAKVGWVVYEWLKTAR
jgi:hypothetical protein